MSRNTQPHIAIRCAYIRAGNHNLLCAVPLTLLNEQDLPEQELIERAERRVADVAADLLLTNSTVQTEIRIGDVSMKNPAYNGPTSFDDND